MVDTAADAGTVVAISARPAASRRTPTRWRPVWAVFCCAAALLLAYLFYLMSRPRGASSTLVDGWGVAAFELAMSLLCISRGLRRGHVRTVPIVLGSATLLWSLGDIALTAESLGGSVPTPSIADAFYLLFYPTAYVGIVLFMRGELRRVASPSWLDIGIAAGGAAAVCSAFAFHNVLQSAGGGMLAVATNLAYPVGDLLLLGLVVGGSAVLQGRSRVPWMLLAGGMTLTAAGDSVNLFGSTVGETHIGALVNGIAWPTAILLVALAMWVPAGFTNPLAFKRPPGFALPGLAAVASLAVLLFAAFGHPGPIAVGLATFTLALVGVRLAGLLRGLHALNRTRQEQAVTDQLTLIGNRRFMFEVLGAWFDEQPPDEPRPLAFLFVDLDRFKEINDSFGHRTGDEVLRRLAGRLSAALREGDVLVRFGGDEFAVLLFDSGTEEAAEVSRRITEMLEEPIAMEELTVTVGASIGVATAPADADDAESLVACADLAMYRAKLSGEPFVLYESAIDDKGDLLQLATDLRDAIAGDRLTLHYQPQLDLQRNNVLAVEALLRWQHPTHGSIPPMRFLPVAEQASLMGELTRWVLDNAIAQCARWHAEGEQLVVAVNISPTNLLDPELPAMVTDLLARHGVPSHALILEITETCVIKEFERCKAVVEELRGAGVIVSIDDFGTGFTSLAYLSGLAAGQLKLDRAFVTRLATARDERDLQLVRSTIDLGHALDMQVVAEGIEDDETLALLRELGCDIVQGFYIGRPVPPAGRPAEEVGGPAAQQAPTVPSQPTLPQPYRSALPRRGVRHQQRPARVS